MGMTAYAYADGYLCHQIQTPCISCAVSNLAPVRAARRLDRLDLVYAISVSISAWNDFSKYQWCCTLKCSEIREKTKSFRSCTR